MQKAIVIAVNCDKSQNKINYELEELKNLAAACNINTVNSLIQNLPKAHPQTYLGKGKLTVLKEMLTDYNIELIIANDELTPHQINHLNEFLKIDVFDRTFLILEIFKKRAKTKEALLQVETATLKYTLPRLTGLHKGLSRQRGTTAQGTQQGRGAGETKLELDRRDIKKQIQTVQKQLRKLIKCRQQQRNQRKKSKIKTVGLVGYTNAGKSTLLNALLKHSVVRKKTVFKENNLFATLETATRLIQLENNVKFLVTDTVGFVNKLPHHLIEAFKSTLEEITEADLIVHVVDATAFNYEQQIDITNSVLKELGVHNKPTIFAFNKFDLIGNNEIYIKYNNAVKISAEKNINIDKLLKLMISILYADYKTVTITLSHNKTKIISEIKNKAIILNEEYSDRGITFKIMVNENLHKKIKALNLTL